MKKFFNFKKYKKQWITAFFLAAFFILALSSLRLLFSLQKDGEKKTNVKKMADTKIMLYEEDFSSEIYSRAKTVKNFLDEQKISTKDSDIIFPPENTQLSSGMKIHIQRLKKISLKVDGKTIERQTLLKNVEELLWENGITYSGDDIILPGLPTLLTENEEIKITRVEIKEEKKQEKIEFKIIEKKDDKLGWRIKKISQNGENGIREITYRVAYHDGKEVSRKIIKNEIVKDPVKKIVVQGTYVKTGKEHLGLGTWYAFRGGLFAANPWLPFGSYVKVTNRDNGKSVIVKINDRGPFGNSRIIDLDKVAFQKIANLDAGVINVKMEEILN